MSKVGRNERCPCGSGRKYKKCHGALTMDLAPGAAAGPPPSRPTDMTTSQGRGYAPTMDLAPGAAAGPPPSPPSPTDMATSQGRAYVEQWSVDAATFAAGGHYAWMESFIGEAKRVLEIGVGDGTSTLCLAASHEVVGVDENPACIKKAAAKLSNTGINVVCQLRGMARDDGERYVVQYDPVVIQPTDVTLIEGDVMGDRGLVEWMRGQEPFDAVTCWLVGAHRLRTRNAVHAESRFKVHSVEEYRLRVQNNVYDLADTVLRPGGILQIVDRVGPLAERGMEGWRDAHKEQASVTALVVERLDERPYTPPPGGVEMGITVAASGRPPAPGTVKPVLLSVVSRKQQ